MPSSTGSSTSSSLRSRLISTSSLASSITSSSPKDRVMCLSSSSKGWSVTVFPLSDQRLEQCQAEREVQQAHEGNHEHHEDQNDHEVMGELRAGGPHDLAEFGDRLFDEGDRSGPLLDHPEGGLLARTGRRIPVSY